VEGARGKWQLDMNATSSLQQLERRRTPEPNRYDSSPDRSSFEDVFQIVFVVFVQLANGQESFGALALTLHKTVFPR